MAKGWWSICRSKNSDLTPGPSLTVLNELPGGAETSVHKEGDMKYFMSGSGCTVPEPLEYLTRSIQSVIVSNN